MENIIFGIATVLLCAAGYYFSWKFYRQDNFRFAIALLILCGLGLYMFVSADFFLHDWDERYHALVAKNLIKHPLVPTLYDNPLLSYDYKTWAGNHIWLHKQPFPLWTMASSLYIFGVNEIVLRLPSIIMSSVGILLTFSIGKYFFDKKVGFLAAFFFSINGLIIEMTGGRVATDHIDISFMFLILLAIFFTIKFIHSRKTIFTILIGVSIGAAILTKWLTGLIILPIWILLVTDDKGLKLKAIISHFILLIIIICAISLPWQLYIAHEFPLEAAWESNFNYRHFTEVIEGRTGPFYYFLNRIRINYGELIYLPLIWFLWKTSKYFKDRKRLALCIWFLVPLIVFSAAKTKMQGYILFTAPALFIMTSEFFFMLFNYGKDHKLKWLFKLVLVLIIALPVRYGIERIKPFEFRDRNPQWVLDLKELNNENIDRGVLINYGNPIDAMFYTDLVAYSYIPEERIITDLMQEGYTVIVNDDNIPLRITTMDGVIIKKLTAANE